MAGLELLYNSVAPELGCGQDALLCFVHWKLITRDYRCLGTGDQAATNERKSEMLPAGWNADKELYTLRYRLKDDSHDLLVKAILMDNSIILNVMDPKTQKVADLTLKVTDFVDPEHLADFDKPSLSITYSPRLKPRSGQPAPRRKSPNGRGTPPHPTPPTTTLSGSHLGIHTAAASPTGQIRSIRSILADKIWILWDSPLVPFLQGPGLTRLDLRGPAGPDPSNLSRKRMGLPYGEFCYMPPKFWW
ncbi:putative Proteasome inhibitor PI31 subunit protein, partial [Naja naja]